MLRGSNLSDVGYGPMTGNASADVAAHQFAKGDRGYRLQAGDAYFREGPFINDFPEISPSALSGLGLGGMTPEEDGLIGYTRTCAEKKSADATANRACPIFCSFRKLQHQVCEK
ncbi:MAG: hypothetical protein WA858_29155 [Xanthobacteraceae bacterium]